MRVWHNPIKSFVQPYLLILQSLVLAQVVLTNLLTSNLATFPSTFDANFFMFLYPFQITFRIPSGHALSFEANRKQMDQKSRKEKKVDEEEDTKLLKQ